jgi:hypothetical protein
MPRRPYTLILVEKPKYLHNDKVSWDETKIVAMLRAAKVVTIAKTFSIIIIHSTMQLLAMKMVLKKKY